jgi:hypothetical protein
MTANTLPNDDLEKRKESITEMTLILDNDPTNQTFNPGVKQTSFFTPQGMKGRALADFLTPESKVVWEYVKSCLARRDDLRFSIKLFFKKNRTFIAHLQCSVSTFADAHQRKLMSLTTEIIQCTTNLQTKKLCGKTVVAFLLDERKKKAVTLLKKTFKNFPDRTNHFPDRQN